MRQKLRFRNTQVHLSNRISLCSAKNLQGWGDSSDPRSQS
uniref:Uncharacterized protein n=1 Tax=Anguilla anguilla TaxID=7936 RepID=A0A0E9UX88_ANGAN